MATKADIHDLTSKLNTKGPLEWVVTGQPVVALFEDAVKGLESLGQPLDQNRCADILRLWVGLNERTHELFVTLTISIKVSPNRNQRRRQGRLMFLVVPAESLLLTSACINYDTIGNDLPRHLFDVPSDADSGKCKLLHASLDFGTKTSAVIMPEYSVIKSPAPQAMTLLRKLKKLSESSRFHLYSNYGESTQHGIETVRTMLLKQKVNVPSIATESLYPGGRPGGENLWVNQGWFAEETASESMTDVGETGQTHTRLDTVPGTSSSRLPPPYELLQGENMPCLPPPIQPQDSQYSSYLPATAALQPPESFLRTIPSSSLPPVVPSSRSYPSLPVNRHENDPASDVLAASSIASDTDAFFPLPEPCCQCSYIATFLSSPMSYPVSLTVEAEPESQNGLVKQAIHSSSCRYFMADALMREFPEPEVEVAASILNSERCLSTGCVTPNSISDPVPDSPSRKRTGSASSNCDTVAAKRVATIPSPTVQTATPQPPYHEKQTSASGMIEESEKSAQRSPISLWLAKAWEFCPSAHFVFIAELLRFADAIERGVDVAARYMDCTLALLRYCIAERLTSCHSIHAAAERQPGNDLKTVVSWLYRLRPGADMEFFPFLLRLCILEQQFIHIARKGEDRDDAMIEYKVLKSDLIGQACMRFCGEVLFRDFSDVVTRMTREGKRFDV
ncbi:hypothetical protein D6D28_10248 [Aureobasidium pullulans]|uniref:Uncharacterized protein n=1 Tax=Aureobasidium pullulans TaxID=5580 RepID=A0A4S8RYK7_AURPU|nr:hypothetical protein D6D28_10248 [Aureobasidium pullulans]